MWVIVEFAKEKSISVVPTCWLIKNNTQCYWPPVLDVGPYVKKCKQPSSKWQVFDARIIGNGKVYRNYLEARRGARKGENTSDLNTSESEYGKKERKVKKRKIESESDSTEGEEENSEDDEYPSFPIQPSAKDASTPMEVRHSFSQIRDNNDNEDTPQDSVKHSRLAVCSKLKCSDNIGTDVNSMKEIGTPSSSPVVSREQTPTTTGRSSRGSSPSVLGRGANTPHFNSNERDRSLFVSEETLRRIARQQTLMNLKLDNLQKDLSTVMDFIQKNDSSSTDTNHFDDFIPAENVEELKGFDKFLGEGDNLTKFICYVKRIGGATVYECIKRSLSRIMNDEVANTVCWNGTANKFAFSGMRIQKGLTAGIQSNPPTKNASDKQIEDSVRSYFRHAKSRLKKKNGV